MEEENPGLKVNVPAEKPPRVRKKRAPVWKHYELFTDGQGKQKANCKRCRSQFVAEGTDGTSHLTRHLKSCTGRQDGAPPAIPAAPPPGASAELSNCGKAANWEEAATADLARMIALHGYDPSFVEDSYFKSFVRQLNPDFQVPSRAAIEDICDRVCDEANGYLESELERTSVKVNLAIDTVETAAGKVLYTACHFIDEDWNRHLMIFDVNSVLAEGMLPIPHFVRLHPFGEGELDPYSVVDCSDTISTLLISQRVFSVAAGNICHLDNERLKVARYATAYNCNDALQMVASCFSDNIDSDFIYEVCWKISSDYEATRQECGEFYLQVGLDHLLPYDKTWISLYFWLEVLHKTEKRDAISSPIHKSKELMRNVFGEIYRASKTISDPNRPTSNIVLRELFKVREALQSSLAEASEDETGLYAETIFENDVVEILQKAKEILDTSIKKEYLQWSIPLLLDPRYKLKHMQELFIQAFGSKATRKYIANIRKEIKEVLTAFSIDGGGETTDADQIPETEIASAHQLELDRYLEDTPVKDTDEFDILNWWKLNSSNYPTLARMARAALAMPTSSKLSSEQMSQFTSIIRGYLKGTLEY